MRRGARRLGAALANLVAVAALVGATATAAGPVAEKLKASVALGSPEGVVAYDKSQLCSSAEGQPAEVSHQPTAEPLTQYRWCR